MYSVYFFFLLYVLVFMCVCSVCTIISRSVIALHLYFLKPSLPGSVKLMLTRLASQPASGSTGLCLPHPKVGLLTGTTTTGFLHGLQRAKLRFSDL